MSICIAMSLWQAKVTAMQYATYCRSQCVILVAEGSPYA